MSFPAQELPSQLATWPKKSPPAISLSLQTVNALTQPLSPVPSACHAAPSHLAIPFSGTEPDALTDPPAIKLPAKTVNAKTLPFSPSPSEFQTSPSKRAMWSIGTPPAVSKKPPAKSAP